MTEVPKFNNDHLGQDGPPSVWAIVLVDDYGADVKVR